MVCVTGVNLGCVVCQFGSMWGVNLLQFMWGVNLVIMGFVWGVNLVTTCYGLCGGSCQFGYYLLWFVSIWLV